MGYPSTPPDPPDYDSFHCACPYCGNDDEHDFIEDHTVDDDFFEVIDVKWCCISCKAMFWWSESEA